MSQATATDRTMPGAMDDRVYQARLDALERHPDLVAPNVTLTAAESGGLRGLLLGIGVVGLILTVVGGFAFDLRHALAAYEIGVFSVTAMALGGMFFTMVFHLTNAMWSTTIRRQFENLGALLPWCMLMVGVVVIIELASGGVLLRWIGIDPQHDELLAKKAGYLNPVFFVIRYFMYTALWSYMALRLRSWSVEQDKSGDRWLSRRTRYLSGWGLLAFAISVAFFSTDFLMALDYRFFSTMWAVYYFAGAAFSSLAVMALWFAWLFGRGKLINVVTPEHLHDLGKLMFAFTVFWGYIAFAQYFLIWYGNLPEETMYFNYRRSGNWMRLGEALIATHFLAPFFLLISRVPKRRARTLAAVATLLVVAHVVDVTYIILPMAGAGESGSATASAWWVILAGVLGVFGVFGFLLVRQATLSPLVPMKDPRLPQALVHKNYV